MNNANSLINVLGINFVSILDIVYSFNLMLLMSVISCL